MTYLDCRDPNWLVEYRLTPGHSDPVIMIVESRCVRPDGTEYDDRWYRVLGDGWDCVPDQIYRSLVEESRTQVA